MPNVADGAAVACALAPSGARRAIRRTVRAVSTERGRTSDSIGRTAGRFPRNPESLIVRKVSYKFFAR
ncbi:hypothetical protein GCM10009546_27100 [Actinomadura livida]|uniref:Uncharacterized protein n=1 Tax=Actinomadura livida TaxID=79909 RepID=A0ABN1EC16_9ACTN